MQPKTILHRFIALDSGTFLIDYINRHINTETTTIDEILSMPLIYASIKRYAIKNHLLQTENLSDYLKRKGESVDELYLLQNGLI
jgi:hypothetical protein